MSELTTTITCVLMLCSMATPKPDINYDCRRISRVFVFTMGINKIVWLKPTLLVQSIRFRKILSNQTPDMQKAIDRFSNDFFLQRILTAHTNLKYERERETITYDFTTLTTLMLCDTIACIHCYSNSLYTIFVLFTLNWLVWKRFVSIQNAHCLFNLHKFFSSWWFWIFFCFLKFTTTYFSFKMFYLD